VQQPGGSTTISRMSKRNPDYSYAVVENHLWVHVQILQDCFEKKDVAMLQDAVTKMSKEDAEYHIRRCIDSGLWVPGGGDKGDDDTEDGASAAESDAAAASDTAEDNVYAHVDH